MTRLNVSFALVVLAAVALPLHADDIAGNGGFEIQGAGGPTDAALWTEFSGGPAGTLAERDDSMPASGDWAMHLVAVGSDNAGASAGINQNSIADVGLPSLAPGSTVSANFDWKATYGDGGVGNGVLRILNGVGAIVASSPTVGLPASGAYGNESIPGVLVPDFGAAPNDVYAAFLEITVGAGAFDGSTAEAFVDNVVIDGTLIPEPSTCALLVAVCLGLGLATRRRIA